MKNPITLRINRLGEFTVAEKARTEVQCGRPGATFYKYMITIEATNNVLTDDGFVAEQFGAESKVGNVR